MSQGGFLYEISEKMTSPLVERMAQKFAQIWGLVMPSVLDSELKSHQIKCIHKLHSYCVPKFDRPSTEILCLQFKTSESKPKSGPTEKKITCAFKPDTRLRAHFRGLILPFSLVIANLEELATFTRHPFSRKYSNLE